MTTASSNRSRSVAAAASLLTVTAIAAGVVTLALGVGVPQTWRPRTGQAFATGPRTARQDPCAWITEPAEAYCERGAAATSAREQDTAGAAGRLGTASVGVAAPVAWRWRSTAGQRRR